MHLWSEQASQSIKSTSYWHLPGTIPLSCLWTFPLDLPQHYQPMLACCYHRWHRGHRRCCFAVVRAIYQSWPLCFLLLQHHASHSHETAAIGISKRCGTGSSRKWSLVLRGNLQWFLHESGKWFCQSPSRQSSLQPLPDYRWEFDLYRQHADDPSLRSRKTTTGKNQPSSCYAAHLPLSREKHAWDTVDLEPFLWRTHRSLLTVPLLHLWPDYQACRVQPRNPRAFILNAVPLCPSWADLRDSASDYNSKVHPNVQFL